MTLVLHFFDILGKPIVGVFQFIYELLFMSYEAVRLVFRSQPQGYRTLISVISSQIYFTGVQAMVLVALLASAVGILVVGESLTRLSMIGGTQMLGQLSVALIVRELAPLMTALIVVARSGAAMTSEIGNMRVHQETELLMSMGINPVSYIVFPRLIGGMISQVSMSIFFVIIALVSGFFVANMALGIPLSYFIESLASSLTLDDIGIFCLKNLGDGFLVSSICCYFGFQIHRNPSEVPPMTSKAVVYSVATSVLFNVIVAFFFYLKSLSRVGLL